MTRPHSKRPRRNRVNKKRIRMGLPPLPELGDTTTVAYDRSHQPMDGVTSMMIPLTMATRKLLTKIRLEQQRQDPSTVASDQLYASAILTTIILQLNEALFPPLITAPTAKAMEQAHAVGKVLARPFVG